MTLDSKINMARDNDKKLLEIQGISFNGMLSRTKKCNFQVYLITTLKIARFGRTLSENILFKG